MVEQTLSRMRLLDSLSETRIEDFVRETIDLMRRFARREQVEMYVLAGLLGVDADTSIDCGAWGIRSASGLAIADTPPGDQSRPRSVLWVKAPHRLLSADRADLEQEEPKQVFASMAEAAQGHHSDLSRRLAVIQFAILAWAAELGQHDVASVQTTTPWSLMPIVSSQPPRTTAAHRSVATIRLNPSDLAGIADITSDLGGVTPRLDIALNRMIRVASEGRDPADSLIDAVIAWENMLGANSETTFKVCASLAWLVEPHDRNQRRHVFARAKKIYNSRSTLVHGVGDLGVQLISEHARDALALAIRAFRAIHSDLSLVEMTSSSRSEAILMGTPA